MDALKDLIVEAPCGFSGHITIVFTSMDCAYIRRKTMYLNVLQYQRNLLAMRLCLSRFRRWQIFE